MYLSSSCLTAAQHCCHARASIIYSLKAVPHHESQVTEKLRGSRGTADGKIVTDRQNGAMSALTYALQVRRGTQICQVHEPERVAPAHGAVQPQQHAQIADHIAVAGPSKEGADAEQFSRRVSACSCMGLWVLASIWPLALPAELVPDGGVHGLVWLIAPQGFDLHPTAQFNKNHSALISQLQQSSWNAAQPHQLDLCVPPDAHGRGPCRGAGV